MLVPFFRALDCNLAIINPDWPIVSEGSNSLSEEDYYNHYFILNTAVLSRNHRKYKLFILLFNCKWPRKSERATKKTVPFHCRYTEKVSHFGVGWDERKLLVFQPCHNFLNCSWEELTSNLYLKAYHKVINSVAPAFKIFRICPNLTTFTSMTLVQYSIISWINITASLCLMRGPPPPTNLLLMRQPVSVSP